MPARKPKSRAVLTTASQSKDPCLALVDPPCKSAAKRHNLCEFHKDGYEGTNWSRVETRSAFGDHPISYIALDAVPPPLLVDANKVVRLIARHTPVGGRCRCCQDPYSTDTNSYVLHTTWHARGDVTSVCGSCAVPGHKHHSAANEPSRDFHPEPQPELEAPDMGPAEDEEDDDFAF